MAPGGVSIGMKRVVVVVGLVAVVGLVWYLRRPTATTAAPVDEPPATTPASSTTPHPPQHVMKLANADERRRVADRIASAQAGRAANHAAAPPSLPALPAAEITDLKTDIRTAMREVIPYLTECYEQALPKLGTSETKIAAKLTLTGDPDVGTLVDAHQIFDEHDAPLLKQFDDCLRDALQQLELPPLAEGDRVEVTYPFVFRSL